MPDPKTKNCEACEQEIGFSETVCPKCGVDFEELEEAVAVVTKAQEIAAKRKAKAEAAKDGDPDPATPPKKKKTGLFGGLGKAITGKKG